MTERILQSVLTEFAQHPRFSLWNCSSTTSRECSGIRCRLEREHREGTLTVMRVSLGCALVVAIAAALAAGLGETAANFAELAGLAVVLLVGAVWAAVPPIVIIPSYSTMSDTAVMLDLAVIGWVLLGLAAAARTVAAGVFYRRRLLPL